MYFKEKEDTNIDDQFKNSKFNFKFNLNFGKLKPLLLIFGGIILLCIIIFIIATLLNKKDEYTIELVGDKYITLSMDEDYIEYGYKAYDKDNNDVTNQLEIKSNVDTSKEGEYEVVYSIGDVSETRYITVKKVLDATYIYLKGNVTMYLEVGEKYNEPGYQVYDSKGEDLTEKVEINNNVDTSKVGTYYVIYSVVNSRNITTTAKRTVIVVNKGQKPSN